MAEEQRCGRCRLLLLLHAGIVSGLLVSLTGPVAQAVERRTVPITTRASVGPNGEQANGFSLDPTISTNGRFVAFRSSASNLVLTDPNGRDNVFVRDLWNDTTTLVSVSSTGEQGDRGGFDAFVSPEGSYVGFASESRNLVPGDTNLVSDVFVRDLARGTTTRVSISSAGEEGNALSFHASISAMGRYVAFHSRATNLVSPDANGSNYDIYVHAVRSRITTRVSVSSGGEQANAGSLYPKITADGRHVVFESTASNLVPRDTNGASDIFVHDRLFRSTTRVSVASSGAEGNSSSYLPSISADGRYVTFRSSANNLVLNDVNGRTDIFVHDRTTRTTSLVSVSSSGEQSDGTSYRSFISADGRYVVFESYASNLVRGDTNDAPDVFVRDRLRGLTERVSVSTLGDQGRWDSGTPAISADGRFVAFVADADNLVPDDTNNSKDILVRGPLH